MVYTLAGSLRFVLVSQFVGEHLGRSKKSGLSPKASPAAEELLNVTHDHSATRERRGSKQKRERRVKKDKMKINKNKRYRETVTDCEKEGEGGGWENNKVIR